MTINIFTYGSLMFSPVWDKVVSGNYLASTALLRGYARRAVVNEQYPVAFAANAEDSIQGIVYFDVTPQDLYRLDCFEGDYYQRISVLLELPQQGQLRADAYIVKPRHQAIISDQLWDPRHFQEQGMHEFMTAYDGFAGET